MPFETSLEERVAVPQPFRTLPHIVHDGSRNPSFRGVMVGEDVPFSLPEEAVQSRVDAQGVDVAVVAHGGGVVLQCPAYVHAPVAELVVALRRDPLRADSRTDIVTDFVLVKQSRVEQSIGTELHFGRQVGILLPFEPGAAGGEINATRRAELSRRLEDVAFLSVIERDFLDVVQRELAQVHLPVLCVAQLYAVVIYARVVRTHAADVDRLQSGHTAVVFDLQSRKITDGISHGKAVQLPQFFPFQGLCGNDLFVGLGFDHYLAQVAYAVRPVCGYGR